MDEQAVVGGPVAQRGEGARRLVEGPGAPEDIHSVERARPDGVGDGKEFGLAVAEDLLPVMLGRYVDVGHAGKPPPGGVELGHRQAVVVQQQPDVLVSQPFVAGHPVVPTPERKAREAARHGRRHPLPEGDTGPERARTEHAVARAEGHRPFGALACGPVMTGHCGCRLPVTIVPPVCENGTGARVIVGPLV